MVSSISVVGVQLLRTEQGRFRGLHSVAVLTATVTTASSCEHSWYQNNHDRPFRAGAEAATVGCPLTALRPFFLVTTSHYTRYKELRQAVTGTQRMYPG